MKEDRLFQALTDIDDDLIEEAGRKKSPLPLYRFGAIAAAVLVGVAVSLLPWGQWAAPVEPVDTSLPSEDSYGRPEEGTDSTTGRPAADSADGTNKGDTTTANATYTHLVDNLTTTNANTKEQIGTTTVKPTWKNTTYVKDPELALIPKWEDKTIKQKYPEIPYGAATYSVYYTIDPKQVGERLTTVTATGQDVYTDTYHTTTVTLYRLADIAPQCAVAIRYAGDKDYYSAVATWYQPLTLGAFLEGLQLEKYGKFGEVSWDYFDEVYHYRTYTGVSKEVVFDLLLDDATLANVYDDGQHFYDTINISVDLPILGLENPVVMMLSEDGYLFTNILGCGKTFYVGTARVEAFKAYLQKNCQSTVYTVATQSTTSTTEPETPNTATVTSTKPAQPPRTSAAAFPD